MIHVHRPNEWTYRAVQRCQRCKVVRRHLVTIYVWYGPEVTCLGCGARRSDGVLLSARRRDAERAARARTEWLHALTRAEALGALMAEVKSS